MKKILLFTLFCNLLLAGGIEFKTLSSDFTQTIFSGENNITYSGNFIINSKIGALWHYKTPNEKLIYFNFSKIVIVEPALEQVIITNLNEVPNLLDILKNVKLVKNNIYQANFDSIDYNITIKNGLIRNIEYIDKFDNKVLINLTNTKQNININDSLLEPKIPESYDIIAN